MKLNLNKPLKASLTLLVLLYCKAIFAQTAPTISYTSPPPYKVGTMISPLGPVYSGGAPVTNGQTSVFAGSGSVGSTDGQGAAASFSHSQAIAQDAQNNLYVADAGTNIIRKISPTGYVSTIAGTAGTIGSANGQGAAASFSHPNGLAVDASGNIYVGDQYNNMIRKISPTGAVTTLAGHTVAGSKDTVGTYAGFSNPCGVAVDASGNVYVADFSNNKIRKITPAGMVSTFAGTGVTGFADGTASSATFSNPYGLAFDASGNLYVSDRGNNKIRKITPAGIVSSVAGISGTTGGYAEGAGLTAAKFNTPCGLTVDLSGNIYVADELNQRIRMINRAGVVSTLAGTGTIGGYSTVGDSSTFNDPYPVLADMDGGFIYVGDGSSLIRKVALSPYTLSPDLPLGLSFDINNGAITGTPQVTMSSTNYIVTAYNGTGKDTGRVSLSVLGADPVSISNNQNYITTYTPRIAGISNANLYANSTNRSNVETNVQYFDGLGRLIQSVQVKGSPAGNDIVQPVAYDSYGREAVKYLPYTDASASYGNYKTTALTAGNGQSAFYATPPSGVNPDPYPQSPVGIEASPLNRVLEQGAPGAPWQLITSGISGSGHTIKITYLFNNSIAWATDSVNSRQVALYNASVNADQSRTLSVSGYYSTGQLSVTVTKNENWTNGRGCTTETYTDNEGHVVLKRAYNYTTALQVLSTYYVYDDEGNLAFVLTPSANPDAGLTSASNQTTLDNLCYQYRYDERKRMSQNKIPGKGWEYTVYNYLDQQVATQDSLQRANKNWIITKYDGMGRVILTGLWNNGNAAISWASLQSTLTGITSNLWETPVNTGNGYTNTSWPTISVTTTLNINYYDNNNPPGLPSNYLLTTGISQMTRGLLTSKKTAVLNTPTDMLWDVVYYDDLGRTITRYAQHYLRGTANTNNYDLFNTAYDFSNTPIATTRQHFTSASTTIPLVTVANTYVYDHMGRKLMTWEQVANGNNTPTTNTLISKVDYNEIGQVWKKHLHSTNWTTFLQDISYQYNERGWMTIDSSHLFAMQLYYNSGPGYHAWNGNIMNQYWGTPGNLTSHYDYLYDRLNRLTTGNSPGGNNENSITYDLEGNITALKRYQTGTLTDNLAYAYLNNGNQTNQLQSITDATSSNTGLVAGTTTYAYDGNGNMTGNTNPVNTSQNKSLTYNLLNLPQTVTVNTSPSTAVTYTYDASGQKLRKVSVINGTSTSTDYISGIEYDNSTTAYSFIQTEEGRYLNNAGAGDYEYTLSDNLGNSRLSFDLYNSSIRTVQQDNYYPFGLEAPIGTVVSPKNGYLYNNKELQVETGQYDYGARFYDPLIGRWNSPDLLAEIAPSLTPYRYCYNNPINFTDPDGLWETDLDGTEKTDNTDEISRFLLYLQAESAINTTPTISQVGAFISDENKGELGKLTNGQKLLKTINILRYPKVFGEVGYKVDQKSFDNFWYQVQGSLTPKALDPRTWHNNDFFGIPNGLSYAGADNPKSYDGTENYDRLPDQIEDLSTYQHDLTFNKLGDRGPNDVFNDPKTQPANAKLVMSELEISVLPGVSRLTRARAIIIAVGIGAADTYNIIKNAPPDSSTPPIDP